MLMLLIALLICGAQGLAIRSDTGLSKYAAAGGGLVRSSGYQELM